jgi:integrase
MARERRDEARLLLAQGIDPSATRKALKGKMVEDEMTFERVARQYYSETSISMGWSEGHAETVISRLEKNIFPWLGSKPIMTIQADEWRINLRRIYERGAHEVASRVRGVCSQIYDYAVDNNLADANPIPPRKRLFPPRVKNHFPTILDPKKVGPLLRAIDGYSGQFETVCALKLAPLVFVRPFNIRSAEWSEFELDNPDGPVWRIPAEKMKGDRNRKITKIPHLVPLSTQAVGILNELLPLTGSNQYLFPGAREKSKCMCENTLNKALGKLGYKGEVDNICVHGLRHMASTLLNEKGFHKDAIERQLAHTDKDKIRSTYNHAEHLPERRKMMQAWADYLDGLKSGASAKVTPLFHKATG